MLALLFSLVIHLFLAFALSDLRPSGWNSKGIPLQINLIPHKEVVKKIAKTVQPQQRHTNKIPRKGSKKPSPPLLAATHTNTVAPIPFSPQQKDTISEAQSEVAAENVENGTTKITNALPPETLPPPNIEMLFLGYQGIQEDVVGNAVLNWRVENKKYSASLEVKLYTFFEFILTSRGTITETGLRPESATTKRPRNELAITAFDWQSSQVTLSSTQSKFPLPAEAQDQLSSLHQFFFNPPKTDRVSIPIVSDRKIDVHDYLLNEETLDTQVGRLKTIHFQEQRKADSSFEFWLANDYYYLPVRIRFVINATSYNFIVQKMSTHK